MIKFKSFDVFREGNVYLLVQNRAPRISLKVDTSYGIAELKEVAVPEDCTASDVLEVLNDLELFINEYKL